jgi:hypothetical protein
MKYEELMIMTDNERLQQVYRKFAKREEKRIIEIQEDLDRLSKRHCIAENDEEE